VPSILVPVLLPTTLWGELCAHRWHCHSARQYGNKEQTVRRALFMTPIYGHSVDPAGVELLGITLPAAAGGGSDLFGQRTRLVCTTQRWSRAQPFCDKDLRSLEAGIATQSATYEVRHRQGLRRSSCSRFACSHAAHLPGNCSLLEQMGLQSLLGRDSVSYGGMEPATQMQHC
jgi:hypothetical protein